MKILTAIIIIALAATITGCSNQAPVTSNIANLTVTSSFQKTVNPRYTCDGDNISPPLNISNIPNNAKTLAIIIVDPYVPRQVFTHWVVWNIPVATMIPEDTVPGTQGINDFGFYNYGGPCPPAGTHNYIFKAYALDTELNLNDKAGRADVEKAMKGHILAQGELNANYTKATQP